MCSVKNGQQLIASASGQLTSKNLGKDNIYYACVFVSVVKGSPIHLYKQYYSVYCEVNSCIPCELMAIDQ